MWARIHEFSIRVFMLPFVDGHPAPRSASPAVGWWSFVGPEGCGYDRLPEALPGFSGGAIPDPAIALPIGGTSSPNLGLR